MGESYYKQRDHHMPKFTEARKQGLLVYVAKAVEEILKDTNA